MTEPTTLTWRLTEVIPETATVSSLYLEPTAEPVTFTAGQYLTVLLPNLGPAEGKAYSISSAPYEERVRLTIKTMGQFSRALLALQPGDILTTSAPYGFFYPESDDTSTLAFLAGGIGITPCLSIIKNLTEQADARPVHLFYSNQTEADIVFAKELQTAQATHANLQLHHFITRAEPANAAHTPGRMQAADIVKTVDDDAATYFICGSMNFTKDLWQDLRAANVASHQLYTEGFF